MQAKLEEELAARKAELAKVDDLDEKLEKEAQGISKSLVELEDELATFEDLPALAEATDRRQERLQRLLEGLRMRGGMLSDVATAKEAIVNAKAEQLMVCLRWS
jgi:hypothetical protein